MTITTRDLFDPHIPYPEQYTREIPLFLKALEGNLDYEGISNNPDCITLASAQVCARLFPMLMTELLRRGDIDNYLVDVMMSLSDSGYDSTYDDPDHVDHKFLHIVQENVIRAREMRSLVTAEELRAIQAFIEYYAAEFPDRAPRLRTLWSEPSHTPASSPDQHLENG